MANSAVIAGLLHNTVTRLTLGHTALNAVPPAVAHQLKPLIELNTSLIALTLHMQHVPPDSLRLLLLGCSRCSSLLQLHLVGGITVLQSKMIMKALAHFTFTHKSSRPTTAERVTTPNERYSSSVVHVGHTPPRANERTGVYQLSACALDWNEGENRNCPWDGGGRHLRSPDCLSARMARPVPRRVSLCNGVRMVLDVQHMDNVVVSFLMNGLEQSERIIGVDIHVSSISQAAARTAARFMADAHGLIARNKRRVKLFQPHPCAPSRPSLVRKLEVTVTSNLSTPTHTATPKPPPYRSNSPVHRRPPPFRLAENKQRCTTSGSGGSARDSPSADNCQTEECGDEEEAGHTPSDDCFVYKEICTPPGSPYTPVRHAQHEGRKALNTLATLPSPSPLCHEPCAPLNSPPSSQGQLVQQVRYLRCCVRDINAAVVRHQVSGRESMNRMVTEMGKLERQLTEVITLKLTDVMVSVSELERIGT
ncbi:hypothetical protein TRVL_04843 [Trypanosoma vivax]|nr:hypothetical protein TRVL_04843 [Trypanosoma vivax]